MIAERSTYCMARITLEATSAHGIHSGMGDATHDVLLVRDANGLPALPGTSIAGVLRHQLRQRHPDDPDMGKRLFGDGGSQAQTSWVSVGWGALHNSQNQPAEGLLTPEQLDDDIFKVLLEAKPLVRDRVRLNHRGTASNTGKFDVTLIPAGARYTTQLGYWCDGSEPSRQDWQALINMIASSDLYLGHGTRNGYGHFCVKSIDHARWDLTTEQGRQGYCRRPRSRAETTGLEPWPINKQPPLKVTLSLTAESAWRIGGGEQVVKSEVKKYDKEPDLLPQHENRILWEHEKAKLGEHSYLLPGSAVKGAIRHRVAYHYRALEGDFIESGKESNPEDCDAVTELFGFAKDDSGAAGLLRFHDLNLDGSKCHVLMHNRIDRFTGGVMHGALFSEEVLWQTHAKLQIDVLDERRFSDMPDNIKQALQLTLEDLANGWLPLGAGGSRGLGVFIDPSEQGPVWSNQGTAINTTSNTTGSTQEQSA